MSMEDILIHRDYPVVRDYVQLPPNTEQSKTGHSVDDFLTDNPTAQEVSLSGGSGKCFGKTGAQRIIRMPGVQPGEEYNQPVV